MSKFQHAPEAVETMAKRLHEAGRATAPPTWLAWGGITDGWKDAYRAEARLVLDRERILTDALRSIREAGAPLSQERAAMALRDLTAYDAPAPPTLLEAAKAVGDMTVLIGPKMDALRAAIEREEGGAK